MNTNFSEQQQAWEAKKAMQAMLAQQLHATHPHLVPVDEKNNALVAAAKNIRKELTRAFPGVKFRVASSRYSGGDSIRAAWIDGPTSKEVEAIIDRYQGGTFDGMTDCYNYEHSAWRDAFGDAKYVFAERSYSDAAVAAAIAEVYVQFPGNLHDVVAPTVEDYRKGRCWGFVVPGLRPFDEYINQNLSQRSHA
jgi:hypothetical protein